MNREALNQLFTIIFLFLAITAMIIFFVLEDRMWFYILGGSAIVIRIVQYLARLFGRGRRDKSAKTELEKEIEELERDR